MQLTMSLAASPDTENALIVSVPTVHAGHKQQFSCFAGNNFRKWHWNFQVAQYDNYWIKIDDLGDILFCIKMKYLIMELFQAPYLSVQWHPVSMSVFIGNEKHPERTDVGQAAIREISPFGWQYVYRRHPGNLTFNLITQELNQLFLSLSLTHSENLVNNRLSVLKLHTIEPCDL